MRANRLAERDGEQALRQARAIYFLSVKRREPTGGVGTACWVHRSEVPVVRTRVRAAQSIPAGVEIPYLPLLKYTTISDLFHCHSSKCIVIDVVLHLPLSITFFFSTPGPRRLGGCGVYLTRYKHLFFLVSLVGHMPGTSPQQMLLSFFKEGHSQFRCCAVAAQWVA